jgi:uncharacterized protein YcbX
MTDPLGRVIELRRFPLKSMQGDTPPVVDVGPQGIPGDRAWALLDVGTGRVASAKNPRLWAGLLALHAAEEGIGGPLRITFPDGSSVGSDEPGVDGRLSAAVGRPVRLLASPPADATYLDEWPDIEGLAPAEFIESTAVGRGEGGTMVSALPVGMLAPGTFQDVSALTLLTTASLRAAAAAHPTGDWDPRRFRANLLVDVDGDSFAENDWTGRRLTVGTTVIEVVGPTPRCVMTTLAQDGLPADREVLRTLARHNRQDLLGARWTCLGAYASVVEGGRIAVGDAVAPA